MKLLAIVDFIPVPSNKNPFAFRMFEPWIPVTGEIALSMVVLGSIEGTIPDSSVIWFWIGCNALLKAEVASVGVGTVEGDGNERAEEGGLTCAIAKLAINNNRTKMDVALLVAFI